MKEVVYIEISYAYFKAFHKLPTVKYKGFIDEQKAKEFVAKIKASEKKWIWNIIKDGKDVEDL